jgi:hypothetical protein
MMKARQEITQAEWRHIKPQTLRARVGGRSGVPTAGTVAIQVIARLEHLGFGCP